MEKYNLYLANIIKFIHICLIIFILYAPFTKSQSVISLNIYIILFILYGWFVSCINPDLDELDGFHFGRCKLTEIECKLRGIEYKNGFIFRIIKPFNTINEKKINNYLVIFMFLWLIINIYIIHYSPYTDKTRALGSFTLPDHRGIQ